MGTDTGPLLIALLSAPERAAQVPLEEIPAILGTLKVLETILCNRFRDAAPRSSVRQGHPQTGRLLSAREAATMLDVTPRWLYRRARRLPFAKRLSPKVLRFSEDGIRRYLETRKP